MDDQTIKRVEGAHREAMDLAGLAFRARLLGSKVEAQELFRQAYVLECEAADLLAPETALEPSRSVLYRSAASLALECGEYREAERLAAAGIAGNPPAEIAEELRDVLQQVRSRQLVV